MRRSGLFRGVVLRALERAFGAGQAGRPILIGTLALLAFVLGGGAQPGPRLTGEDGKWGRVIYGNAPSASRLRINTHGPVTLEGGVSKDFTYTVKVAVSARSEGEARRVIQQYAVRAERQGQWLVFTAPGGAAMPVITMRTPRLNAAVISTSAGAVEARGVDGSLDVDSGAGELIP